MASSLYIGTPGAGKTFGVVKYPILQALRQGQRVVTNVPLDEVALVQYLGVNLDGLILLVDSDTIKSPRFWFTAEGVGETITKAGDRIVIDESHEFYGSDKKIKSDDEIFRAMRLQRKYAGGSGNFSTDIILVTQLYTDIAKAIREVCESMYYMQKMKVIGKPDTYRVDIFADCRSSPTRARPVEQLFGKYESEYFRLYNSYSAGVGGFESERAGQETDADERLNVWNGAVLTLGRFKLTLKQTKYLSFVVAVVSLLLLLYLFWGILTTSNPVELNSKPSSTPVAVGSAAVPTTSITPSPAVASSTVPATPAPLPASSDVIKKDESTEYTLVGLYQLNGMNIAVVQDTKGVYRHLIGTFSAVSAGPASHIKVDGKIIAPWTGKVAIQDTSNRKMESSK